MQYKFVAIDLDDTLLDDDLRIAPQTIQAIQDAVKMGVYVTLATGRMYQSAAQFAREIDINIPIITYQGAYVKNIKDKEVIYQRFLSKNASIDIITKLKEKKKAIQIYLDDELYTDYDNPHAEKYSKATKVKYHLVDDLVQTVEQADSEPMKVLMIDEPEIIRDCYREFTQAYGDKLNITISKPTFLEFSHKEATKGQAISHLLQQLHISKSELIAIGDSLNDLDMLQMAGLGVAMENAHPEVKEIADYITKTNNDLGVLEVFQKFLLK